MTAAIGRADTRLAEKHPAIGGVEQGREHIAVMVLRFSSHRCIRRVALFITGLRLFPASFRTNLRRDEGRRSVGQSETALLAGDDGTFHLPAFHGLPWQFVTECHVAVAHLKAHGHLLAAGILTGQQYAASLVVCFGGLGAIHAVVTLHRLALYVLDGQSVSEVADTCSQS